MPRRPHTKTRSGCTTCKARKVRCDETKPVCQNCTRGDRPCRYPIHLLEIPSSGDDFARDQPLFPVRDMELMHYWTSRTFTTMTQRKEHFYIWRDYVPQLAFDNRFLLHGMLALTALHKRYAEFDAGNGEALLELARYHQQHALALYIPLLRTINEHNCHALVAFSIILAGLCFGLLHDEQPDNTGKEDVIVRFIETFDALIGTMAVVEKAQDWLHQGELYHLVDTPPPTVYEFSGLESDLAAALERLLACAANPDLPNTTRRGYLNAIYALATIMSLDPNSLEHHCLSHLVGWAITAGTVFINLVKQRDPLALVILGHYGVALTSHGNLWMLQGNLASRLTNAVYEHVDEGWKPLLQWAKIKVQTAASPDSCSGNSAPPT